MENLSGFGFASRCRGNQVYVNSGKYRTRLENLNSELGGGIDICEISSDSVSSEDLITWVAEGRIDYTVATDEIARFCPQYLAGDGPGR